MHWRGYHDHKERLYFNSVVLFSSFSMGIAAFLLNDSRTPFELGVALASFFMAALVYRKYGLLQLEYKILAAFIVDTYLQALTHLPSSNINKADLRVVSLNTKGLVHKNSVAEARFSEFSFPAYVSKFAATQIQASQAANKRIRFSNIVFWFSTIAVALALIFANDMGLIRQAKLLLVGE